MGNPTLSLKYPQNFQQVLPSALEILKICEWEWESSENLKDLRYFQSFFDWFLEGFRGFLEKPQSNCFNSHLKIWGFLRLRWKNSRNFKALLISKNLKTFDKSYPQPQIFSKFWASVSLSLRNSRSSRMRMRILENWEITLPPYLQ